MTGTAHGTPPAWEVPASHPPGTPAPPSGDDVLAAARLHRAPSVLDVFVHEGVRGCLRRGLLDARDHLALGLEVESRDAIGGELLEGDGVEEGLTCRSKVVSVVIPYY